MYDTYVGLNVVPSLANLSGHVFFCETAHATRSVLSLYLDENFYFIADTSAIFTKLYTIECSPLKSFSSKKGRHYYDTSNLQTVPVTPLAVDPPKIQKIPQSHHSFQDCGIVLSSIFF